MAIHYLVDFHTPVVASSEINDVRLATSGSITNGSFVVSVPDEVNLGGNPSSLTDLITKKYAGLLAFHAGFTRITYDDLLDATGVDVVNSTGVELGERRTNSIYVGNVLQSNAAALTGPAPAQAIITWEVAFLGLGDVLASGDPITRSHVDYDPSANTTCQVSFNGGVTFLAAVDGSPITIPVLDQGTSFVIQVTNTSLFKLAMTSWAVIY